MHTVPGVLVLAKLVQASMANAFRHFASIVTIPCVSERLQQSLHFVAMPDSNAAHTATEYTV